MLLSKQYKNEQASHIFNALTTPTTFDVYSHKTLSLQCLTDTCFRQYTLLDYPELVAVYQSGAVMYRP